MLYITTRNRHDAYTAHRAIHEDRAPDGGSYVPFRMPVCDEQMLSDWNKKNFGKIVADVLKMFVPADISGWDVDFSVGKNPVRLVKMGRRVTVAQLWRNSAEDYEGLEKALARLIYKDDSRPSEWVRVAIRISFLAAALLQMIQDDQNNVGAVDIAVTAGDFMTPIAVWYLRQAGFPVGKIICSCNENSAVWDLLRMGEARTDVAALRTDSSAVDAALPPQMERLICGALGQDEAVYYSQVCQRGGMYKVADEKRKLLQKDVYVAAVSNRRIDDLLQSVYTTNGCVVGPQTAMAYGGLLDYRARSGENRRTLLFEDRSPVLDKAIVSSATGLTESQLRENLA